MAHSSPGDNGSQARERTALHSGLSLRPRSAPCQPRAAPGNPPGASGCRGTAGKSCTAAPGGAGLQGGIAGDTQRGSGVRMMGKVWGVFSPGSVSLCKRCLFTLAAPEGKRCLRDLDRVFLCALMEETKNWEHNTAVMEIQMWWKAMGNQGREMGMKSVPLRGGICTQTLRGALEPH